MARCDQNVKRKGGNLATSTLQLCTSLLRPGRGWLAVVMVVMAALHELSLDLTFDLIEAADLLGRKDCGKLIDIL